VGGTAYYGTADATPRFAALVGELSRWGLSKDVVQPLLPHVDRALEWIDQYGDRDGDGFVEYLRPNTHGLSWPSESRSSERNFSVSSRA
jgi:glycogen debranching enzyme